MPLLNDQTDRTLPADVLERLETAEDTANGRLSAINARMAPLLKGANTRLSELRKSNVAKSQRIIGIRHVATTMMSKVMPDAACKKGCDHCCHVLVGMTQTEADVIGKAIGRKAVKVKKSKLLPAQDYGYHMPCTFLKDGACSIYEHRPLTCRTYFNLDKDELLCRLIPGKTVPLPLLNATVFQTAYMSLSGNDVLADIREFFPPAEK